MALEQMLDGEHARGLAYLGVRPPGGRLARTQAEGDVFEHRHVRVQRVVLEHHRDVALARRLVVHEAAADRDAPLVGVFQAGDGAQQRALAAA